MRHFFLIAATTASLWTATALADEPAACYIARDPTGDFVPEKVPKFDADPQLGAQIAHLTNESANARARCVKSFYQRNGGSPIGNAGILYGARISAEGKVMQVSVLHSENINDGMLMACLARSACEWNLEPSPDGRERLVRLPPVVIGGRRAYGARE